MKTITAYLLSALLVLSCAHAQWEKIGQKSGGQVNGLETNKYGTLFCSFGNRVYRSIDGGNAWSARIVPTEAIQGDDLYTCADSSIGHAILLQTGRDSVYRSTNEGDTWELMNWLSDALNKKQLYKLFATRYGDLYAASTDGSKYWLWKSRDNGNTFISVLSDMGRIDEVYQSEDSTLYVVQDNNLIRIKTNGSQQQYPGAGVRNITSTRDFSSAPIVLYATKDGQPQRSKDFGATWTALPIDNAPTLVSKRPLVGAREGEVIALCRINQDSAIVFRLSAGGTKWTKVRQLSTVLNNPLMLQNGTFLATGSDGMYLSEDASSWTNSSQGIESFPLVFAATVNMNTLIAGGINGKVFKSVSQGQLWGNSLLPYTLTNSDFPFSTVFVSSKTAVILSTTNGLLYSNDQGSNFVECMLSGKPYDNATSDIIELANGNIICATSDSGIIRSTDGGLNWQPVSSVKTGLGSAMLIDHAGNILLSSMSGVMKCDPTSFELQPFEYTGKLIPWLASSPNGSLFAIERTIQGTDIIYKLHRKKQGGSDEVFDFSPGSSPGSDDHLQLAASYKGDAYITTGQGLLVLPASATVLNKVDYFRNDFVTYIRRERSGSMIAATAFGGIYADTSGVVSVHEETTAEGNISLYPNPAASYVVVQSQQSPIVSLTVSDLLGNTVLLWNGTETTSVSLNTSGLASGTYLMNVRTQNGTERKKMSITK